MLEKLQNENEQLFYPGMNVEVFGPENNLIFYGKIRRSDEDVIEVVEMEERELPPVIYNSDVKVVGVSAKQEIAILYGQICGSTKFMWRLDRLSLLRKQERRGSYRQRVLVDADVQQLHDGIPGEEVACQILDVSMGGAQIRCQESFQQGDKLLLTKAHINPSDDAFAFICQVQRSADENAYGCEFKDVPPKEEERLFRAILSVQREEIKKKRNH